MLYPQVSTIAMNRENGGHSAVPILGVPMPEQQSHYASSRTQEKGLLLVVASRKPPTTAPGNGRTRPGSRHHRRGRALADRLAQRTADARRFLRQGRAVRQYRERSDHRLLQQIVGVSWFNALAPIVWDVNDPKNPRPIAYYHPGAQRQHDRLLRRIDDVSKWHRRPERLCRVRATAATSPADAPAPGSILSLTGDAARGGGDDPAGRASRDAVLVASGGPSRRPARRDRPRPDDPGQIQAFSAPSWIVQFDDCGDAMPVDPRNLGISRRRCRRLPLHVGSTSTELSTWSPRSPTTCLTPTAAKPPHLPKSRGSRR